MPHIKNEIEKESQPAPPTALLGEKGIWKVDVKMYGYVDGQDKGFAIFTLTG